MTNHDEEIIARWARMTDPAGDPITSEEVRALAAQSPTPQRVWGHRRTRRLLAAAAVLVAVAFACSLVYVSWGDDGTTVESASPSDNGASDASMWGHQWTLVTYSSDSGDIKVPGSGTDSAPVLDLTIKGEARFTGCNTGTGLARVEGGEIMVDGLWSAEQKGCKGDDGVALMELDGLMADLLQRGTTVSLADSTLTFTDEATVATFEMAAAPPTPVGDEPAHIRVSMEPGWQFREGFDVGLRFETPDGTIVGSTTWADFVRASGATGFDAFYDSVLDQPVPPGTVIVRAEVAIGPVGPPIAPDPTGDLPCRLSVDLYPGETISIEVLLGDAGDNCLRPVPDEQPTTTLLTAEPDEPTVPRVDPVLEIGTGYYVDVDIRCAAFDLAGLWVLVEGDPSSWQPAGERHEGGTFTLDSATTGVFHGDAAGTKRATFRLLPDRTNPGCSPIPR